MNAIEIKNKTARVISTLFIPPFFSLIVFIYLPAIFIHSASVKSLAIFNGIAFSVIFPMTLFFVFRKKKLIADDDAKIKEQRLIPFLWGIGFYLVGLVFFLLLNVPAIITYLWISNIIITSCIIIVNLFWKISVHAAGVGTFLGLMFFLFGYHSLFLIILVLLVCWSRIYLKCHNIFQVSAGALLGFSVVYFLLITLK